MRLIARLFFIATATVALSWFLPWLYDLSFPETGRVPFVQYSPLTNRWVVSQFSKDNADPDIFDVDKDGVVRNHYTVEQRDSLLPQIYYSRLMAKSMMPDSIAGVEVTMPMLRHNEMVQSVSPRNFVLVQPEVWLIMESMPVRFNFEDPKEAFRFTDDGRVEFITIETNTINAERSRRFTDVFAKNRFKYPAKWLNANITTRKGYDNGYLLIDASGDIFHMKQQAGRPYMTRIPMVDGETARYAFVMEGMNRADLGIVISDSGRVYRLLSDYVLQPVPEVTFDSSCQRLMIVGNYFNRVYRVGDDRKITWYAVDGQTGELLDVYSYELPESVSSKVAGWIFPYQLVFTSGFDSLAYPRIKGVSLYALLLGAALALILMAVYRRRRESGVSTAISGILTLWFGVFLFVPLMLIRK